jgi:hypothetical protein
MPKGVSSNPEKDKRKNNSRPFVLPELLKKNWTVRVTDSEKEKMKQYLRQIRKEAACG